MTTPQQLLVRGRWLFRGASSDDPVLSNAAIVITGEIITDLGAWEAMRERYPGAEVLGSNDVAIIPGLINAHHHTSGASHAQQGISDDLLELWILELARARSADPYLEKIVGAARLLRSGVTSVVELHPCSGRVDACATSVRRSLRAYAEAGLRVALAPGTADRNQLVSGAAEEVGHFLAGLPADARSAAEALLPGPDRITPDEYLALMDELCREHREHPRIDVWFGPPGPHWVSDDFMQQMAERAATHGTHLQTHLSESIYEKLAGLRLDGRSPVLHLNELGVLGRRFSVAHGVWLTQPEIDVLAETGTALSHNPGSNLRLRAGIAPINALRAAGVTVALGMDGTTLNDDEDMFTEMRLALRLHRTPQLRSAAPTPLQVLEMATRGGARLLGKEMTLGQLAPGYAADVVLVDLARITWPWIAPEVDPLELIALRAQAGDVRTVLVGGKVVFDEGRPTQFDLAAAARELAEQLNATPYPAEAAEQVHRLRPYIEAHYASWQMPERSPYTPYNSRT